MNRKFLLATALTFILSSTSYAMIEEFDFANAGNAHPVNRKLEEILNNNAQGLKYDGKNFDQEQWRFSDNRIKDNESRVRVENQIRQAITNNDPLYFELIGTGKTPGTKDTKIIEGIIDKDGNNIGVIEIEGKLDL